VSDFDVAVIGFGPCGALAANLLGQAGLTTLAIDKAEEIYPLPRALALDHEIFRLFDNIGVLDAVRPHVAPFTASQHFGAQGQLIRRIDMVPPPHPQGYTPSMVFRQPPVEAALRAAAGRRAGVRVALGTELVGMAQSDTAVTLRLRGTEAGTVTARAVIGCDGASSVVRQMLGIGLEDLVFDEPWIVIDVMVNEAAAARLPHSSAQYCEPARPTSYLIGVGLHRRWEIMLLPGEDPREMVAEARIWQLLSRWIGPEDGTLWRAATYRFHALVAETWHRGRVFLAGDAAHQQPPFIGQGMCQGLRDVANLVWRLEHVLRGRAGPGLFDSYGAERGAHVRRLTGRIKAIGQVICERDPELAAARDARVLAEGGGAPLTITRQEIVPPLECGLIDDSGHKACGTLFPQPLLAAGGLMDAVCGTGWRLVVDARMPVGPGGAGPRRLAIGPHGVAEAEGVLARWFDAHACHAALVRPDHYVFGVAAGPEAVDGLVARLRQRADLRGDEAFC
jgi:3-(3-hydroxy-phenyl)propionate hydroxylase